VARQVASVVLAELHRTDEEVRPGSTAAEVLEVLDRYPAQGEAAPGEPALDARDLSLRSILRARAGDAAGAAEDLTRLLALRRDDLGDKLAADLERRDVLAALGAETRGAPDAAHACALAERGYRLLARKDLAAAEAALGEARLAAPRSATVQGLLGVCLLAEGTPGEALRSLDDARTLAPASPLIQRWRGEVLLRLARYAEAADELEAAAGRASDPVLAALYRRQAEAARRRGRSSAVSPPR
jgi:predicted Zn-dependent protease